MPDAIKRNRHTIRLEGYDYSLEGAYFVTILTYHRASLFGSITNGEIALSPSGKIAFAQCVQLEKRFPQSDFSTFVVMPNHIHGIILVHQDKEAKITQAQVPTITASSTLFIATGSLGSIVRAYKSSVAFRINALRGFKYPPIWQRNYFERIIRNDKELDNIWKYIDANPGNWEEDEYHPSATEVLTDM